MVLDHAYDVQFLNGDHAEAVDDLTSGLVNKVMAAIANPLMDTGNNFLRLPSFSGAANLLCQLPLGLRQSIFVAAEEARVLDILAIGQRCEGFQSNVNADLFLGRQQQFGANFAGEAGIPLVPDTANGTGLYCAVNRTVQTNGNIANLGQAQSALLEPETTLWIGERIVPVALHARKAWCFSCLNTAKESVEGEINTDSDVLQDLAEHIREFRVFLFPLWESGLLLCFGR